MDEEQLRLDEYAAIIAALGAGRERAEVLAAHGLDEPGMDALESAIEARLTSALDAPGAEFDPFLSRYEAAMRVAQLRAQQERPVSVDTLARAIVALERGTDPRAALERAGLTAAELSRAITALGAAVGGSDALLEALEAQRSGKAR